MSAKENSNQAGVSCGCLLTLVLGSATMYYFPHWFPDLDPSTPDPYNQRRNVGNIIGFFCIVIGMGIGGVIGKFSYILLFGRLNNKND